MKNLNIRLCALLLVSVFLGIMGCSNTPEKSGSEVTLRIVKGNLTVDRNGEILLGSFGDRSEDDTVTVEFSSGEIDALGLHDGKCIYTDVSRISEITFSNVLRERKVSMVDSNIYKEDLVSAIHKISAEIELEKWFIDTPKILFQKTDNDDDDGNDDDDDDDDDDGYIPPDIKDSSIVVIINDVLYYFVDDDGDGKADIVESEDGTKMTVDEFCDFMSANC